MKPNHFAWLLLAVPFLMAANTAPDPRLRVEAAGAIYDLNLNADQLHALEKMASSTESKQGNHPRIPADLKTALNDLSDAYAKGDESKINSLEDKVDQLEQKADLDDAEVEITDAAKRRVGELLHMVSGHQLAGLISSRSDDVMGAGDALIEAMDEARSSSKDDYDSFRDDTARDVAELAVGLEGETSSVVQRASAFLDKVRKLSDGEFKSRHQELEEEARKIGGNQDPFMSIRRWTERELARLLSNPQLEPAIEARMPHAGEANSHP